MQINVSNKVARLNLLIRNHYVSHLIKTHSVLINVLTFKRVVLLNYHQINHLIIKIND
jgi:hypothetical protein